MINVLVGFLARNHRVVLNRDELPYLVDDVTDTPDGGVGVVFSSGDAVDYTVAILG